MESLDPQATLDPSALRALGILARKSVRFNTLGDNTVALGAPETLAMGGDTNLVFTECILDTATDGG